MAKEITNKEPDKGFIKKTRVPKPREKETRQEDAEEDAEEGKIISLSDKIQPPNRTKGLLKLLALVILIVACIYGIKWIVNRDYKGYELVSSVETTGESVADYIKYGDNVLKVTKDGASYIDSSGNAVWDSSYNMNMPTAKVSGDYAVVADINGRDVYIFNKSGKVSNQTLNYDIANVDVASDGLYTLVLEGEDTNYISGFDKDSKRVYELRTSIENSGYPLDVTISEDGSKLLASYVQIDGTKVVNYLAAYNFDSVGQNENADRLVGGFTYDDSIFPIVNFVNEKNIVCYGDTQIVIFSMPEKPSIKAKIDLNGDEMLGVFANAKHVGYITKTGNDENGKYTIKIFDLDGKKKAEIDYNNSFKDIYATEDELIVIGDFGFSVYRFNGKRKFTTSFAKSVENVVPDSKKLEYIVIFEKETDVIKLKRRANGEN